MLIRGSLQRSTITIDFAVHGERGNWTVAILAPSSVRSECETTDFGPWRALDQALNDAYESADHGGRLVGGAANR
jgi:hypothetical protein